MPFLPSRLPMEGLDFQPVYFGGHVRCKTFSFFTLWGIQNLPVYGIGNYNSNISYL